MRMVVIGAGAVGGYFGGRLAETGADVTFLVRERKAIQLRQSGLIVKSFHGDFTIAEPKLAVRAEDIGPCDLVILGLKNYHLSNAIEQIKTLVSAGAKILPIVNGIEHFEVLKEAVGQENVLGGMCQIISTLDAEGVVHHTSQIHRITFGPLNPEQEEFCERVKAAMETANMKVTLSKNILLDIWTKYSFITAYSGVTTASRLPIDEILACEAAKQVYAAVLREMWALARRNKVELPDDYVAKNLEASLKYEKGSTSSMHQDFRKGLPLEVESIQGAAVRLAEIMGLELPTVRTIYGLLKPYELGTR